MAIPVWPDIPNPSYGTTVDMEDTSLVSSMEDGMVQARRKFTKSRKTWKLRWNGLPKADYLTLADFLQNTAFFAAVAFTWVCPLDGKTYTVRYAGKEEFETINFGRLSGSITLTEV